MNIININLNFIIKNVQQKSVLHQFVKSYEIGQGGVDTFLQIHNFTENGCLQIYATKKCPKASLYFLVFFQGGRFQQKEWGQHIFVVGGGTRSHIRTIFEPSYYRHKSTYRILQAQTANIFTIQHIGYDRHKIQHCLKKQLETKTKHTH